MEQDGGPLVVFADEAHPHLDTALGWGWAPRGQRLYVNSASPSLADFEAQAPLPEAEWVGSGASGR